MRCIMRQSWRAGQCQMRADEVLEVLGEPAANARATPSFELPVGSDPVVAWHQNVIAVTASILTTAYHMLAHYRILAPTIFPRCNAARGAAKLANRIRNLGFDVEIRPAA